MARKDDLKKISLKEDKSEKIFEDKTDMAQSTEKTLNQELQNNLRYMNIVSQNDTLPNTECSGPLNQKDSYKPNEEQRNGFLNTRSDAKRLFVDFHFEKNIEPIKKSNLDEHLIEKRLKARLEKYLKVLVD